MYTTIYFHFIIVLNYKFSTRHLIILSTVFEHSLLYFHVTVIRAVGWEVAPQSNTSEPRARSGKVRVEPKKTHNIPTIFKIVWISNQTESTANFQLFFCVSFSDIFFHVIYSTNIKSESQICILLPQIYIFFIQHLCSFFFILRFHDIESECMSVFSVFIESDVVQ